MMRFFPPLFLLATISLRAAEIDHFSIYGISLSDSRGQLNQMVNQRISWAVSGIEGCRERELYSRLRKYFNNHVIGELTRKVMYQDDFDRGQSPSFKESIYREFRWWRFMSFVADTVVKKSSLADVFRVGDVYLGTDKLAHFWGRGFSYFRRHHWKGEWSLEKVLRIGRRREHRITGAWVTGMASYADMVANFNGMRFWNHMLQKREDALGQNLGPYIQCQGDRWVPVKEVDMGDYIDHGMDESINCSRFLNQHLRAKALRAVQQLSQEKGVELTCPIRPEVVGELRDKYGPLAEYLLNFEFDVVER